MCKIAYGGFPCGHASPEGTTFAVEPCANEATCEDFTYHVQSVGLRDASGSDSDSDSDSDLFNSDFDDNNNNNNNNGGSSRRCAECQAVLGGLRANWAEWREYLRAAFSVPELALDRAEDSILAAFRERRALRITLEGDEHRAQDEYADLQTELTRDVKAFAERLQRADEDWDEHMTVLQHFGGPWDGDERETGRHERRLARASAIRERARGVTAADDDWDEWLTGQRKTLDRLYEKVLKSDVPVEGGPPMI